MRTALLATLLILPGCGLLGGRRSVPVEHAWVTTDSGVEVLDLLPGVGAEVQDGQNVTIDYVAKLEDDTQIDSTHDRGLPVTFRLGVAPIGGWNEGLLGMRVGGQRRLVVPYWLAYGDEGVPGLVPPKATLVFDVELIEVSEDTELE